MKLWLLRPRPEIEKLEKESENPWEPWYDKCFGMVIRGETEDEARKLAASQTEGEYGGEGEKAWLSSKYSRCEVLSEEGKKEVIIKDEHWA